MVICLARWKRNSSCRRLAERPMNYEKRQKLDSSHQFEEAVYPQRSLRWSLDKFNEIRAARWLDPSHLGALAGHQARKHVLPFMVTLNIPKKSVFLWLIYLQSQPVRPLMQTRLWRHMHLNWEFLHLPIWPCSHPRSIILTNLRSLSLNWYVHNSDDVFFCLSKKTLCSRQCSCFSSNIKLLRRKMQFYFTQQGTFDANVDPVAPPGNWKKDAPNLASTSQYVFWNMSTVGDEAYSMTTSSGSRTEP